MTIETSGSIGSYIEITSVQAKFVDPVTSNVLSAKIGGDNLADTCIIHYNLMNLTNDTFITLYTDSIIITGTDYTNWTGDSTYVYTYLCTKLNLTAI